MKYKVGDKVRIVKKWCGDGEENSQGLMNKWLGKVMTIIRIDVIRGCEHHYHMKEDKGERSWATDIDYDGWIWRDSMIEGYANDEKIVITRDGNKVTAQLLSGKKCIKKASAKCSPCDEFSFETGAKLAVERLLEEKLKPCPFCGSEVEVQEESLLFGGSRYQVRCPQCNVHQVQFTAKDAAIKAWNTRED